MKLNVFDKMYGCISNYDLYLMPRGIYKTLSIRVDNYLYPMYFIKYDSYFIVSTSVYGLINFKGSFVRNPNFQTTDFYRPTFQTIDLEIMRARTEYRRSSNEYSDPVMIAELAADIMQGYISEIEEKFSGYVNILMMGGKDSQNIILAERKEKWIVISGEPNSDLNKKFIHDNKIDIEEFVAVSNDCDLDLLSEEIIASDCFFDVAHFRYMSVIKGIIDQYNHKAIIWYGSSGDGCFTRNANHKSRDYYNIHDLHVGMAMGIWHQLGKNLFDCPTLSPYQSPDFLTNLFYKYDPYYVDSYDGDLRVMIGKRLFGGDVKYPVKNPEPGVWIPRKRSKSIDIYIKQLANNDICISRNRFLSVINKVKEFIWYQANRHSAKRRTKISYFLFPIRVLTSKHIKYFEINRYDIKEI